MRLRKLAFGVAVFVLGLASAAGGAMAQSKSGLPYRVVSDSYYHVDPAAGTMSVRVQATFYNSQSSDLKAVPLWVMPDAQNVSVTEGATALTTALTPFNAAAGLPGLAVAQLPAPLRPNTKVDVVLTYDVPPQSNSFANMAPGIVESPFVSQGQGSFVLVDVPKAAQNYFDPGCIVLADQPKDVVDAGDERWMCGEILRAVFGRTTSTEAACAHLDDRCRQQTLTSPILAFAQSITDPSTQGVAEADVPMARGNVHLTFRYFKRDEGWALKELDVAKRALPKLEALFGFPLPVDGVSLRESHHIEVVGALGLSYNTGGDILVAPDTGMDDEVTVHELAHQWAGANLVDTWEAEGLAEYAMRSLAPSLGFTPSNRAWQSFGYTDVLSTWGNGSTVGNADYWYGKAGAFFFALEQAIGGPAKMTQVLATLDPHAQGAPFDGRYIMDRAEAVSGANLDDLFLKWVFNPATSGEMLKQRRAAHDLVKTVTDRATSMGLVGLPTDIKANLDAWIFDGIAAQVDQANKVLDSYASVVQLTKDSGLDASDGVAKSWGSDTMANTMTVIEDQRLAVESITSAATELANEQAGSPALAQLAQARKSFAAGDFAGAKQLASGATATQFNTAAAGKLIELAKQEQASFHASFLSRIGLLFMNPSGDLAAAQKAYVSGDPKKALDLSRSAYDDWNEAQSRGLQRLAMVAGLMCALSVGIWYLLRRLEHGGKPRGGGQSTGHFIEPAQFKWHDWENH